MIADDWQESPPSGGKAGHCVFELVDVDQMLFRLSVLVAALEDGFVMCVQTSRWFVPARGSSVVV